MNLRWDTKFTEWRRCKELFGDCSAKEWKDNPELGSWVREQRKLGNRGKLRADRKARLDALGFVWDLERHARWQAMFAELKRYKGRFGDCDVPKGWDENPKLSAWVTAQRTRKKGGTLSIDRQAQLDALGFDWDPLTIKRRTLPLAAE